MTNTSNTNRNAIQNKRNRLLNLKFVLVLYIPCTIILFAIILPYIISSQYLAAKLSQYISNKTNSQAHIKAATFSWIDGFKLNELTLNDSESKSIIHINSLQMPINLFDIAITHQFSYIRITGLNIELSETRGYLPLIRNQSNQSKSFILPAKRIQIEGLNLSIKFRDNTKTLLTFPWLEIIGEQSNQSVQWYGHCRIGFLPSQTASRQFAGKIALNGNLRIAESAGQKIFAGTIKINWRELSLRALSFHKITQLSLTSLDGTSSGNLTFTIFPDFKVQWNLHTIFNKLNIQRKDNSHTKFKKLDITSIGKYDPLAGNIDMSRLDIESSSVKLTSKFNLDFDNAVLAESNLQVSGTFDTKLASLLFPDRDNNSKLAGYCNFDINCKIRHQTYTLQASLNANNAEFQTDGIIRKLVGQPANLKINLQANTSNWPWMTVKRFDIKFGQLAIDGFARLPRIYADDNFESWITRARNLGQIEFNIHTKRIESLTEQIIPLKKLFEQLNLSGTTDINIDYTGQNNIASTELKIQMAKGSTLKLKNLYVKPKNQNFSLSFKTYWPWKSEYGKLSFLLDVKCGKLNIKTYNRPAKLIWSFWKKQNTPKSTFIDLISDIGLQIDNSETLIDCSPLLQQQNIRNKFAGTIKLDLANVGQFVIRNQRWDINKNRTFARVDATQATFNLPEQFQKQIGQPLRITLDYKYNQKQSQHKISAYINSSGITTEAQVSKWQNKGTHYKGHFALNVNEITKAIAPLIKLKQQIGKEAKLTGQFSCAFNWSKNPSVSTLNWNIDATNTNVTIKNKLIKADKIPATIKGGLSVKIDKSNDLQTYTFAPMTVRLANNLINLEKGSLKLSNISEDNWLKLVGAEPWIAFRKSPIKFFDAKLTGKLQADEQIKIISPQLAYLCKKYNADGYSTFNIELHSKDSQLRAHLTGDLKQLSVNIKNCFFKPKNTQGTLNINIFILPDSQNPNSWFCSIEQMNLTFNPLSAKATGYCKINWSAYDRLNITQASLNSILYPLNLKTFEKFSPILKQTSLTGSMSANINLDYNNKTTKFGLSFIEFDNIKGKIQQHPFALDGKITFSNEHISCDELNFLAGSTSLKANWQSFAAKTGGLIGYSDFISPHIDLDELRFIISEFATNTSKLAPANSLPVTQPKPNRSYEKQIILMRKLQPLFRWAEKSSLLINFNSKIFLYTDYSQHVTHNINNLICKAFITENKKAIVNFWGKLSDGMIKGSISADLSQENPTIILKNQLYNLKMNPSLQPLVENFFPGLKITGRISINESYKFKMFRTSTAPNNPVGNGEMIFIDGYMIGKAAPDWVTKIFPQLNFAKYRFSRMRNWFYKTADGRIHNNMIYRGKPWNIYIEGDSYPDGRVKYEVGVDLLARFESQYWSSVGQGRVPIFTTEGVIKDGKFIDEKIHYVPPHKVIYQVFVKNNLLTAAYRILKRQITNRKKSDKNDKSFPIN